jgi:hypothetical protein
VWFDDIGFSWAWSVLEGIVTLINVVGECLSMVKSGVLVLNKSSCWRDMSLAFLIVIIQGLIEVFTLVGSSSRVQLFKDLLEFILKGISFLLEISVNEFIRLVCSLSFFRGKLTETS